MGSVTSVLRLVITSRHKASRICLRSMPTGLNRDVQHPDDLPFCVPPSLKRCNHGYRNINLFPISYAFQPRLRGRLTLGRLSLPRKPWAYGEEVSHFFYRYSCQHDHFPEVQQTSRFTFIPQGTLPYCSRRQKTEIR
jgi:hypothetical protein